MYRNYFLYSIFTQKNTTIILCSITRFISQWHN